MEATGAAPLLQFGRREEREELNDSDMSASYSKHRIFCKLHLRRDSSRLCVEA